MNPFGFHRRRSRPDTLPPSPPSKSAHSFVFDLGNIIGTTARYVVMSTFIYGLVMPIASWTKQQQHITKLWYFLGLWQAVQYAACCDRQVRVQPHDAFEQAKKNPQCCVIFLLCREQAGVRHLVQFRFMCGLITPITIWIGQENITKLLYFLP